MIEILFAFLIGWAFDRAQMGLSATNYNALYNGYGVIDLVNKREIKAPMAYRVLVPWLVGWIETTFKVKKEYRVIVYQNIKMLFVMLAAWSVIHVYGIVICLLTFTILLLTIQFDYWDWPIELAAVVLASGGHFVPALIVALLFALSRETAPITALIYFVATLDILGSLVILMVTLLVMVEVKKTIGDRPLYCKRFMFYDNLKLYKNFFKWKPILYSPITVTAVLTLGSLISVIINPQYWYVLILLVAGWILAKADEPRIFSSIVPFIAIMIGGAI